MFPLIAIKVRLTVNRCFSSTLPGTKSQPPPRAFIGFHKSLWEKIQKATENYRKQYRKHSPELRFPSSQGGRERHLPLGKQLVEPKFGGSGLFGRRIKAPGVSTGGG